MAKNYYFENFENSGEQNLVEDLVIESIRIYGMDVWYIPRTLVGKDDILNEDDISTFNDAYMAEMYVKSVDGFEGEGDFLSKFGLQIRDSITMTIAQRTYESEIGSNEENTRPLEGDLIYLPLNKKIFEIQHVEHESIFYQMGSLQTYDLRAELFEFSGERFSTGHKFIDDEFKNVNIFESLVVADNSFTVQVNDGYAFYIKQSSASGDVLPAYTLELNEGIEYTFDQSHASNHISGDSAVELGIYNNGTTTLANGYNQTTKKFTPVVTGTYEYKALNGASRQNDLFFTSRLADGIPSNTWQQTSVAGVPTNVDPIGGNNANTYTFQATNSGSLSQAVSISPSGRYFTASIYVKSATAGMKLRMDNSANDALGAEVDIPQSSEWQRVSVQASFGANISTPRVSIVNTSGTENITSVQLWGAMLQNSSGALEALGNYQPVGSTFSATDLRITGGEAKVIVSRDALSDNTALESFIDKNTGVASDNIIDFSQSNPFGEDTF